MRQLDPQPQGHGRASERFDNRRRAPAIDLSQSLDPLIRQLREYDNSRIKLEEQGGFLSDVNRITELLSTKFGLEGYRGRQEVSLTDGVALRRALRQIGEGDVHLDVRQLDTCLPVYYLCRVSSNWWAEYTFVVEEFYRSPGYALRDERFVRMMRYSGHEHYFLRLSPFRSGLAAIAEQEGRVNSEQIDRLLDSVGRHVLAAAWHEDQAVGLLTATHFQLPQFGRAIELLYLSLSAELCELRAAVQPTMLRFFEVVYPQPAIRSFLELLTDLDGGALSEIPQKALKLYSRLSKAFSNFIQVEVTWGNRQSRVPLYKLVFANLSRLQVVAQTLRPSQQIDQAAKRLEEEAQMVIDGILTLNPTTIANRDAAHVLRP